jgi:hypothetical protein
MGVTRRCLLAALGLMCGVAGPARADLIIGNYPPSGERAIEGGIPGTISVAAGFTMPAGSAYTLDSVTMRLQRGASGSFLDLELYGDVDGHPGGPSLDALAPASLPPLSSYGDVTATPHNPFILQGGTTYWISLTCVTGTIYWPFSHPGITPTGIATSAGYTQGSDNPPTAHSDNRNSTYRVDGTLAAVPEPSSLVLLGVGGSGLWLRSHRRRRASADRPG